MGYLFVRETEYLEGLTAYLDGVPVDDNPYEVVYDDGDRGEAQSYNSRYSWNAGWKRGEEEDSKRNAHSNE